ncbi:hypothetical protein C8J57DRAFT_1219543 [Mycena rebaudengoi]|nr:hypothetical protein C8J57DRAFT_1219543 [Mycena rebaudengoi]
MPVSKPDTTASGLRPRPHPAHRGGDVRSAPVSTESVQLANTTPVAVEPDAGPDPANSKGKAGFLKSLLPPRLSCQRTSLRGLCPLRTPVVKSPATLECLTNRIWFYETEIERIDSRLEHLYRPRWEPAPLPDIPEPQPEDFPLAKTYLPFGSLPPINPELESLMGLSPADARDVAERNQETLMEFMKALNTYAEQLQRHADGKEKFEEKQCRKAVSKFKDILGIWEDWREWHNMEASCRANEPCSLQIVQGMYHASLQEFRHCRDVYRCFLRDQQRAWDLLFQQPKALVDLNRICQVLDDTDLLPDDLKNGLAFLSSWCDSLPGSTVVAPDSRPPSPPPPPRPVANPADLFNDEDDLPAPLPTSSKVPYRPSMARAFPTSHKVLIAKATGAIKVKKGLGNLHGEEPDSSPPKKKAKLAPVHVTLAALQAIADCHTDPRKGYRNPVFVVSQNTNGLLVKGPGCQWCSVSKKAPCVKVAGEDRLSCVACNTMKHVCNRSGFIPIEETDEFVELWNKYYAESGGKTPVLVDNSGRGIVPGEGELKKKSSKGKSNATSVDPPESEDEEVVEQKEVAAYPVPPNRSSLPPAPPCAAATAHPPVTSSLATKLEDLPAPPRGTAYPRAPIDLSTVMDLVPENLFGEIANFPQFPAVDDEEEALWVLWRWLMWLHKAHYDSEVMAYYAIHPLRMDNSHFRVPRFRDTRFDLLPACPQLPGTDSWWQQYCSFHPYEVEYSAGPYFGTSLNKWDPKRVFNVFPFTPMPPPEPLFLPAVMTPKCLVSRCNCPAEDHLGKICTNTSKPKLVPDFQPIKFC